MLGEDAPHDLGLAVVDLDTAADRAAILIEVRHRVIAVRHAARREAFERAPFETAERLVTQLLDVHVTEQALHRERELRALRARVDAVRDAEQRDGSELQTLEDRRRVADVAADPRQVFGHDYIDAARIDRGHHRLEAGTRRARAGDRVIGEDQRAPGVPAALRDERAAATDLILDARFPLIVGRESSIDSDVTGLELGMHVAIAFVTR